MPVEWKSSSSFQGTVPSFSPFNFGEEAPLPSRKTTGDRGRNKRSCKIGTAHPARCKGMKRSLGLPAHQRRRSGSQPGAQMPSEFSLSSHNQFIASPIRPRGSGRHKRDSPPRLLETHATRPATPTSEQRLQPAVVIRNFIAKSRPTDPASRTGLPCSRRKGAA